MKIRITKMNDSTQELQLSDGATVSDALSASDFDQSNCQTFRDGEQVSGSTSLNDGDLLTLSPKVQGGSYGHVRVGRLGHGKTEVSIQPGDTVGDVLARSGLDRSRCDIYHNSVEANLEDSVSGGDTVTISPKVQGGN